MVCHWGSCHQRGWSISSIAPSVVAYSTASCCQMQCVFLCEYLLFFLENCSLQRNAAKASSQHFSAGNQRVSTRQAKREKQSHSQTETQHCVRNHTSLGTRPCFVSHSVKQLERKIKLVGFRTFCFKFVFIFHFGFVFVFLFRAVTWIT